MPAPVLISCFGALNCVWFLLTGCVGGRGVGWRGGGGGECECGVCGMCDVDTYEVAIVCTLSLSRHAAGER